MNYTYFKDYDTRDNSEIYLMKVTSNLSKQEFNHLSEELKRLGGYYSKFKKAFLFRLDVQDKLTEQFPNSILSKQEINDLKNISIIDFCEKNGIELSGTGNWKRLQEHDSCVIDVNNNSFIWNSKQKSGDIINFVEEYYNVDFKEATQILGAKKDVPYLIKTYQDEVTIPKELKDISLLQNDLQEQNNMKHVYAYLNKTRKIDYAIVQEFVDKKLIAEDINRNLIFKTFDKDDKEKLIALSKKGTSVKPYQFISLHSENVGFRFSTTDTVKTLYVYEAPIDLMSHYEMNKEKLIKDNALLVAMTGLKSNAVLNNIKEYDPEKVVFCVDNDSAGKHFIEKMRSILPENLTDKMEILLPDKKDWNEDIKEKKHLQEKEEIQETLNLIKEKANSILQTPELMKEFIAFSNNFNNYSVFNMLYIHSQRPDASFVAAKSFFNQENIRVKKDELKNPIKIFKPEIKEYFYSKKENKYKQVSQATEEEKELIKKGLIEVNQHLSFVKVPVYDITQTHAQKTDYPRFLHRENLETTENIDVKRTLVTMVNELRRKGINVDFKDLSNPDIRIGTKGYTDTENTIVLNLKDTPLNRLQVLTHEYAHCILHNQDRVLKDFSTKLKEFEAETTSFICLQKFGLASKKDSPLYIMNWGKEIVSNLENNVNDKRFSSVDVLKDIQEGVEKVSEVLGKSIVISKEIAEKNSLKTNETKTTIAPEKQNSLAAVHESGINYNLKKEMEQNKFWNNVFQSEYRIVQKMTEQEQSILEAEKYIKDYSSVENPTQEEKNNFKIAVKKRNCCAEKNEILKEKLKEFHKNKSQPQEQIIEERTTFQEECMIKL